MRKPILALLVPLLLVVSAFSLATPRTQALAEAIAKAEGFYSKGTIPNRCHNAGDLKVVAGWAYPGQVGVCKGGHVRFRNDAAGWAALNRQLEKIAQRESKHYLPEMTLQQMSRRYAGNSGIWAKNVAHNLGTSQKTTLAELLGVPPEIHIQPSPHVMDSILSVRSVIPALAQESEDWQAVRQCM